MRRLPVRSLALSAALLFAGACIPSGPETAKSQGAGQPTAAKPGVESVGQGAASVEGTTQAGTTAPAQSAADLLQEWRALAENGELHLSERRPIEIGLALLARGPENLTPVLDVLGDPNSKPGAKALAMVTLRDVAQPSMAERLKSMCKPDQDGTMRTCATDLLSHIASPDTLEFLKTLTNDPEKRVRIASLIGLVSNGDVDARTAMIALYRQPDSTPQQKVAMILTITDSVAAGDIPILREAVVDGTLDTQTRAAVALVLGRIGDDSAIESLTRCTEESAPETLRKIASDALTAIRSRSGEAKQ